MTKGLSNFWETKYTRFFPVIDQVSQDVDHQVDLLEAGVEFRKRVRKRLEAFCGHEFPETELTSLLLAWGSRVTEGAKVGRRSPGKSTASHRDSL